MIATHARSLDRSMPEAIRAVRRGEPARCNMYLELANTDLMFAYVMKFTTIFGAEAQTRGGALVHGALAVRGEIGILLTAPGGTGKTTASNRLPTPWVSLCDDTTLVVHTANGDYWAHPWPTWSRFLWEDTGGS